MLFHAGKVSIFATLSVCTRRARVLLRPPDSPIMPALAGRRVLRIAY